jgi:isocitrate dehydrogenase kinase/phosphatase
MHGDARERLDLYKQAVDRVVEDVQELLEERREDRLIWAGMKAVYSNFIADDPRWELAETFFNSVTRRIFTTVGVNPEIEFVDPDFTSTRAEGPASYRSYGIEGPLDQALAQILADCRFASPFEDLSSDAAAAAQLMATRLKELGISGPSESIDVLSSVFYRGMGAYLVGRIRVGREPLPFVLALLHGEEGITIDGVLTGEDELSILFSFARAYFLVECERPSEIVRFLKQLMPRKRVAEIYISCGYNKHGKTELYRDLLAFLASSDERFEIAPGQPGMVMVVFALPGYDMVFKVIKDRFAAPKDTTRRRVMEKYDLVHHHDRAGRLLDAQAFEFMEFERCRFSEDLLTELAAVAPTRIRVTDRLVIINHAYVERQVTPLDLHIRSAGAEAGAAVIDYGNAIRDLAATDIFAGDLLLKNFGVTRHGRVVFYDYDEIRPLTSCRIRRLPNARSDQDELASEPWFDVEEGDVFPEEFGHFLGLPPDLFELFCEHHGELLTVEYWTDVQKRLADGERMHIFPYRRRLRPGAAVPGYRKGS